MRVILLPCFSMTTCVKNIQLRKQVPKQVILKKNEKKPHRVSFPSRFPSAFMVGLCGTYDGRCPEKNQFTSNWNEWRYCFTGVNLNMNKISRQKKLCLEEILKNNV